MKKRSFSFIALLAFFATVLVSSASAQQEICAGPPMPTAQISVVIEGDAAAVTEKKVAKKIDRRLGRKIAEQQKQQRRVAMPNHATSAQPISGSADYCTRAYSSAEEQYCDEAGEYIHRSSSVSVYHCCRHSFDQYGVYDACTAGMCVWKTDVNGGGGGCEGLRDRFTELLDGSVVVQRRNGQVITFNVAGGACEVVTTSRYDGSTGYRQWSNVYTDRRATSNFDHSPVSSQPWASVSNTVNTETVWEGFEICEIDVGE